MTKSPIIGNRHRRKLGADDYICLPAAADQLGIELSRLPFSVKILLENSLRHLSEDEFAPLLSWFADFPNGEAAEIMLYPSRILMQDFTGIPAIADLAAMRDEAVSRNLKAAAVNPTIPVDLVIDHSITVENFAADNALAVNGRYEFSRNRERYRFLHWGKRAFSNFRVAPPGRGICHQINLERLAEVVSRRFGVLMPDLVLGTDSHTTMVNGLGVLGWGVGGIEAEAALLGQPLALKTPQVVGVKLDGALNPGITATDLVLNITKRLREFQVVGKFIEFYGDGLDCLSLPDRATIANMSPEFGATCAVFPIDEETIKYLELTGREPRQITTIRNYCEAQRLWRSDKTTQFSQTLSMDLAAVEAVIAGPKRPQDMLLLRDAAKAQLLAEKEAEQEAGKATKRTAAEPQKDRPQKDRLSNGSVVIAAITSCTNTSNPAVMLAAGLVAKKAAAAGLFSKEWVKTSLAPGSLVVEDYLNVCGLMDGLKAQGFHIVGYGCTTCIGNSGPLPEAVEKAVQTEGLTVAAVLSGNRNFEGRIHSSVKCSYLASPPLVVAYALAGTMHINLAAEPLGNGRDGKPIYLKDIWPSPEEVAALVAKALTPNGFRDKYRNLFVGDDEWRALETEQSELFNWQRDSSYIRKPPFFAADSGDDSPADSRDGDIKDARALLLLGDSVTTDHISPAGNIAADSPAGQYLKGLGEDVFNSYGARRGNHEVMIRGTFANPRLKNFMVKDKLGGFAAVQPQNRVMSVYQAAMEYRKTATPLVIFAGQAYGSGSSRDWAAKGTKLLGVKAVIAAGFERIHRSNLVGMGVMPLQFEVGDDWRNSAITGGEKFDIIGLGGELRPQMRVELRIKLGETVRKVPLICRLDTVAEAEHYYPSGGVLNYVLNKMVENATR